MSEESPAEGSAALAAAEQEVLTFLKATSDDQLAFARRLIATPSPTPPGDERAVALLVQEKLEELGVRDVTVLSAEPTRPNLVVRIPGQGPGKTLILSGHLDTKPPGDLSRWRVYPYDGAVFGGVLHGLGSGDMKAAIAAMVYTGAALSRVGGWAGELDLVLTADEEGGSTLGSKWLAEEGHLRADAAIIGEPCGVTREWESIGVVCRGSALFDIEVVGTQMHSSVSDRFSPVNATVEMAWLIAKMHDELLDHLTYRPHHLGSTRPTVNIGVMVEGGVFYGVYPGNARFSSDIRLVPGMTCQSITADLQGFLDRAMAENPRLDATLKMVGCSEATEIPSDHPVVTALQHASHQVLGQRVAPAVFPGATDALSFQGIAGIPTVAAFGPGLVPRAHAPNERLAMYGVNQAARIYALAALRYLAP
ncbi:MAG: M20/M25/M40 family metallo-hydrolase [Acidimicrobiia bacterium]|nr:M20/M25/M40 family metallo-hydrolase [Acidimicrobiia bacterium]